MINKYPTFENEIIMSTQVCKEDDYIIRWIEYYKMLGVTRFIIYDNWRGREPTQLPTVLEPYISSNQVVLIQWSYAYNTGGQVAQQTHSIHAFRTSKYIGLFDVDEYINLQAHLKIEDVIDILNNDNSHTVKILNYYPDYLNHTFTYDNTHLPIYEIGGYRFLCKRFLYNNTSDVAYEFFKAFNCMNVDIHGREKFFVNPRNVHTFGVHAIINGKPMITVPCELAYFNHYMFLNKHVLYEGNCYNDNNLNRYRLSDNMQYLNNIDTSIMKFYDLLR